MDIVAWLRDLGLERYAEAFRENDVDVAILPKLTAEDLLAIGVTSVGHRRKLLEAIAALAGEEALAARETDVAPAAMRPEAERRQLTVMFVDLVGSTALSARLDPEDMREVIRAYQDACAGVITRFQGHVAKYMGDGVLAYFGWPRAHEDEAERAVRAGLALAQTVGELEAPTGEWLAARIGIATGVVVVGDLVGEGASQEQAVVGETPNLAARLQALAQPGQVVIAGATRRLLEVGFEIEDLGEHVLKGMAEPIRMFAVTGERGVESRFEARSGPSLLPMVGRDQELALLLDRWAQAKAGEGQSVLLVGEAGIGKSRIARALLDAIADEPHVRIRYQCSPFHADSALWPVIQQLSHAAGFASDDPVEARLDKLEALLERSGGGDAAALMADLLALDGAARYGALDLMPQVQRARTLEALVQQLLGPAAREPVLVVLEDAHWIDPTTLEMIGQALDRSAQARVLILLTSRPDQQPERAGHPHVTRLTLNRLGRAGVEKIVARLGGDRLPAETIDAIIGRTDGVPLFVEELTKAVLETGEASIPASLHDSLMARLDRIPEVKEIAQTAACIGREFDHSLVVAIAAKPETELVAALERLRRSELVFRRGAPPDATYTFKHALVRDAAYESLLKTRRQAIHRAILEHLEGKPNTPPELLARHAEEAGQIEKAIGYWQRAAQLAADRSALREAARYYQQALKGIERLPERRDLVERGIDIRLDLRDCLVPLGEIRPALAHARAAAAVAAELGDLHRQARARCYESNLLWHTGELRRALGVAERAVAMAASLDDRALRVPSRFFLGQIHQSLGNYRTAIEAFERMLEDVEEERDQGRYGLPFLPAAHARTFIATSFLELGDFARGYARAREGMAIAEATGHPFTIVSTYWAMGDLCLGQGELEQAVEILERGNELRATWQLVVWYGAYAASLGLAYVLAGRIADGIALLEQGLRHADTRGIVWVHTRLLRSLGEAYVSAGQPGSASDYAHRALRLCRERGQRGEEGWTRWLLGRIGAASANAELDRAEQHYRDAIEIADSPGMRRLRARTLLDLALLHRSTGAVTEARSELTQAIDLFRAMDMTTWRASAERSLADTA